MKTPPIVKVKNIKFGGKNPFVLIAGPCVIEDRTTVLKIAKSLKQITDDLNIPFIFKASYDKANRTSVQSFRGPGIDKGLEILEEVKSKFNVPVISDVHTVEEVVKATRVLDVMQIPAFLCRQTDLLIEAGRSQCVVNIKKGQFLSPESMEHAVKKVFHTKNKKVLLTERGSSFGYNQLVTDFRSLPIMRDLGCPVVMDATHSVQQPGALGNVTGGRSEFIPLMARCGVAAGCDGVFMEVHTNPAKALSDGPNMLSLKKLPGVLKDLQTIDKIFKSSKAV